MMRGRVLYHLARADFLERVRRYSFLLTLAFAAGLAFLTYSGNISLQLDEYRGVYNSAWVGSMLTLVVDYVHYPGRLLHGEEHHRSATGRRAWDWCWPPRR